jgi:hypothetical protein
MGFSFWDETVVSFIQRGFATSIENGDSFVYPRPRCPPLTPLIRHGRRYGDLVPIGCQRMQRRVVSGISPPVCRRTLSLKLSADRLDFGVSIEHLVTHFSAPPGLSIATEGQRSVDGMVGIYPHGTGSNFSR